MEHSDGVMDASSSEVWSQVKTCSTETFLNEFLNWFDGTIEKLTTSPNCARAWLCGCRILLRSSLYSTAARELSTSNRIAKLIMRLLKCRLTSNAAQLHTLIVCLRFYPSACSATLASIRQILISGFYIASDDKHRGLIAECLALCCFAGTPADKQTPMFLSWLHASMHAVSRVICRFDADLVATVTHSSCLASESGEPSVVDPPVVLFPSLDPDNPDADQDLTPSLDLTRARCLLVLIAQMIEVARERAHQSAITVPLSDIVSIIRVCLSLKEARTVPLDQLLMFHIAALELARVLQSCARVLLTPWIQAFTSHLLTELDWLLPATVIEKSTNLAHLMSVIQIRTYDVLSEAVECHGVTAMLHKAIERCWVTIERHLLCHQNSHGHNQSKPDQKQPTARAGPAKRKKRAAQNALASDLQVINRASDLQTSSSADRLSTDSLRLLSSACRFLTILCRRCGPVIPPSLLNELNSVVCGHVTQFYSSSNNAAYHEPKYRFELLNVLIALLTTRAQGVPLPVQVAHRVFTLGQQRDSDSTNRQLCANGVSLCCTIARPLVPLYDTPEFSAWLANSSRPGSGNEQIMTLEQTQNDASKSLGDQSDNEKSVKVDSSDSEEVEVNSGIPASNELPKLAEAVVETPNIVTTEFTINLASSELPPVVVSKESPHRLTTTTTAPSMTMTGPPPVLTLDSDDDKQGNPVDVLYGTLDDDVQVCSPKQARLVTGTDMPGAPNEPLVTGSTAGTFLSVEEMLADFTPN